MTFKVTFNSQLKFNNELTLILLDESLKLKYVNYKKDKPIYFKKKWSKSRIQKALNQLYIEQDINSPHRYLTDDFNVDKDTIVADIGCAEANFSLFVIY